MNLDLGFAEIYNQIFAAESIYHKPDGISLEEANKVLVTFAFTRHPFERLMSSYFELQKTFNYNLPQFKYCNFTIGMPDQPMKYANYVINVILADLKTQDFMSRYTRPNNCYYQNPTHFIPQFVTCPYCQLKFDLVGRLEDMEADTAFLAKHLGLKVQSVIYLHLFQYNNIGIFTFSI